MTAIRVPFPTDISCYFLSTVTPFVHDFNQVTIIESMMTKVTLTKETF